MSAPRVAIIENDDDSHCCYPSQWQRTTTTTTLSYQDSVRSIKQQGGIQGLIENLDQAMERTRSFARCMIACEAVRVNKRLLSELRRQHAPEEQVEEPATAGEEEYQHKGDDSINCYATNEVVLSQNK